MTAPNGEIRIQVLGSGTSAGIPTIGCKCAVCHSADPRDNRLRPSIAIHVADRTLVVDTTPDFRAQALRFGVTRVNAVLFTHAHADHIMGLDDLRPFNFHQGGEIPIYASAETMEMIQRTFSYIFSHEPSESWIPRLAPKTFSAGDTIEFDGFSVLPLRVNHGRGTAFGFRIGQAAYLTDHSDIPDETLAQLQDLDVLFLDALRHKPHPTHSTVQKSLGHVEKLKPKRAYFTHISHDLGHERTESLLPPNVRLAYDGLEIIVPGAAN